MDFAMEISIPIPDAFGSSEDSVDACAARPKSSTARRPSLPPRNKSVQFSPLSVVWEFAPSPAWRTWYKPHDQERFKKQRTIDVLEILARPKDRPGSSCPIGLEQVLSDSSASKSVRTVVRSVLVEQHRQRACGVRDPGQMRFVSSMLTAAASERARGRGRFQETMAVSTE